MFDAKKKEMQDKLDSILILGKTKLEMTNEIQKLFKSDCGTFQELNLDPMEELLADYILSPQWDRERTGCWYEENCDSGKKRECRNCPKMDEKMMEGYAALAKDHLEFANQALDIFAEKKIAGK